MLVNSLLIVSSSLLAATVWAAPAPQVPETVAAPDSSPPELIVVLASTLSARGEDAAAPAPSPNAAVLAILNKHDAEIAPVFDNFTEVSSKRARADEEPLPDLSIYFKVDAPEDQLEGIAEELRKSGQVEGAYVRPAAGAPSLRIINRNPLGKRQTTPNFTPNQGYLGPAPGGINVNYALSIPGGRGEGVRVIDCEWGWNFQHEDLVQIQGGVIFGQNSPNSGDVNHGTGVAGVLSGDNNNFGVTGISPTATFFASSFYGNSVPAPIVAAANILGPGDIILLEIHIGGPNGNYIAVEWYPDIYAAIKYATAKGIVVVEAAGNGNEDFDNPIYNIPNPGFPSDWTNPFNLNNPSSGAVMVGAGAHPPGTHGVDNGPDRSRLWFSNYGSRVDAQGWGAEVTTTGVGNLYSGNGPNQWYMNDFSGTSSASPIVTGAIAVVNGVLKSRNGRFVNSEQARTILRSTGSPQQNGNWGPATQRIGNRPNLSQLIPAAIAIA